MVKSTFSLFLSLLMLVAACATTPVTERRQMVIVPDGTMNELGVQAYSEMKASEAIVNDPQISSEVVSIGRRIAKASEVEFDWEFTVFESEQINAFCLPGGKIGVYTGILPVAQTNAGLAAIMGHEVAHATARHGAERVSQAMVLQGILIGASEAFRTTKYRDTILAALGIGAQVGVMMPYSRRHESEADEIGLIYMAKAGYDPREAPKLWERMAEGGAQLPEILSTHPDPRRRAEALAKEIERVMPYYEASQKQVTERLSGVRAADISSAR